MPRRQPARRTVRRRTAAGSSDLLTLLDQLQPWRFARLGPDVWAWLWLGTMRLLAQQEPRAFARVLTKLEQHGIIRRVLDLGVPASAVRSIERDPDPVVTEPLRFRSGRMGEEDAARARIMAYVQDARPVALRGRSRRLIRPARRTVLVLAYYAARWKLKREPPPGPQLPGDPLEDHAVALVARRYSLTVESARATIHRVRATLHTDTTRWLRDPESGPLLWRATMTGPLRDPGAGPLLVHALMTPEKVH